jgi:hypothetical protein
VDARSTILRLVSQIGPRNEVASGWHVCCCIVRLMRRQESIGVRGISRHWGARGFAICAAFLFVGWSGACGKSSQKLPDASSGGTGGSQTDAATDTGGATRTAGATGDAGVGSGGATGTGDVAGDADGDVVSSADAGQDVPPAEDAAADANQSCGDTTCHSGQACVMSAGAYIRPCMAPVDGGCPLGLVPVAACDEGYLPALSPGCIDPPPTPSCVDIPDACDDLCNCVCHAPCHAAGTSHWVCDYP